MKERSSRKRQERTTQGGGIVQGSIVDPRQQRLDHAGIARVSQPLRFGAYCAGSANIRARNSTGFFLFLAMCAMPAIGSQRSAGESINDIARNALIHRTFLPTLA
jgi:hypothetical protein